MPSSSFAASKHFTPSLSGPHRRNQPPRPSSLKCQFSNSDHHDSSNSTLFKTLSAATVVVSSATALFHTDPLHFLLPDFTGGNAGGGVGGPGASGSSGEGGGGWFNGSEGCFCSSLFPLARAITDEPKSQDWDSHDLPVNIVAQVNKLSGFKRYKISEIVFFDRSNKTKIGTEDSFLEMVSHRPGGVYTKAQLQKELESLATCGMFEKVELEGKTNADGSLSLMVSLTEST